MSTFGRVKVFGCFIKYLYFSAFYSKQVCRKTLAQTDEYRKTSLPLSQHPHGPLPSNDYSTTPETGVQCQINPHQPDSTRGQEREGKSLPPSLQPPYQSPAQCASPTPSLTPPCWAPTQSFCPGQQRKGFARLCPVMGLSTQLGPLSPYVDSSTPGPTWGLPGTPCL